MRGFLHPDHNVLKATQNSLCRAVNRRRGCCAYRASNCRRRARFSRTRSSLERKTLTNQPRKCRSDTIMARILAEKPESSFAPSHSFCECTTFWRDTARDQIWNPAFIHDYASASLFGNCTFNTAVAGNARLDPLSSQQPHLDDLRKAHVSEQREHKDWPVQPRQVREAQRRGHWRIRQPHPKSHDC
jgi:hypothetical protein